LCFTLFRQRPLIEMAREHDAFFGQPSRNLIRRFQQGVKAVLDMGSWLDFFKFIGVAMPGRAKLAEMLRNGVRNSRKRGYHKDGMDFNRIHASGTSKILRKGESFLAAATLNEIDLEEHWSWDSGDVKYLDASCLLFNGQHQRLGLLDYNNMKFNRSDGTSLSPQIISHSGDQLDHDKESGFHQISAQLNKLPKDVHYIYITVSSWADARIKDIRQPSVRLCERGGHELCRYNVESADGDKTAILMCVLHRRADRSTAAVSRWALEAIGEVGMGSAGNYEPIYDSIENFRKTKNW